MRKRLLQKRKKSLLRGVLILTLLTYASRLFSFFHTLPLPQTNVLPSRNNTFLLYLVSTDDEFQCEKVRQLEEALGSKHFRVVWGDAGSLADPNDSTSSLTTACPFSNCIPDNFPISKSQRFSDKCCAHEKALMWAIANRDRFDYVWLMEDDVHFTDISSLTDVLFHPSTADLLHQRPINVATKKWFWTMGLLNKSKKFFPRTQMRFGLFNLFRFSSQMLGALDGVYQRNGQEWFFLEAMLPTAADYYKLKLEQWYPSEYSERLRYRPCYRQFPSRGIYHPAKNRNGIWQDC